MKIIKIIFPYFGQFPPQFKFWWKSALNNSDIYFIFITDNRTIRSEKNIKVIYMTFKECCERIKKCFNFEISLCSPYKLCDFKPAYYYIFHDFIGDCDFWGWGDVDLIYGKLRDFITENVLSQYDLISGWGHLTLLRNTEYWNNFFMLNVDGFVDYHVAYQTNANLGFDEYDHKGTADKAKHLHKEKVWDTMLFDDLRIPETNFNFKSGNRRMFENDNLIFEYSNLGLFRVYLVGDYIHREPTMYLHFKRRLKLLKVNTNNTDKYLVVPNKIIPWESITWGKIYNWTKCNLLRQYAYYFYSRVNRKFKKH